MQRVDLLVNGRLLNVNQRSDNPALQRRVLNAISTANRVEVRRHSQQPPATDGTHLQPALLSGRGIFTVERPEDVHQLGLHVDYSLEMADTYFWRTTRLESSVAVCQDESKQQYDIAMARDLSSFREKWLCTTLDGSYHPLASWPEEWGCMVECYWNADGGRKNPDGTYVGRAIENMVFRAKQVIGDSRWGKIPIILALGCYDASRENPGVGVRLTLLDYLPHLRAVIQAYPFVVGYAVWRVETLDPLDIIQMLT